MKTKYLVPSDHYRPVRVAHDDGMVVSLLSGVKDGEDVALNLGESVADGSSVQPVKSASTAK